MKFLVVWLLPIKISLTWKNPELLTKKRTLTSKNDDTPFRTPDNHQIWKFRYKWNFKNWCRFFQKTRHSSNIEILLSVGPRKRIAPFKPPEINQRSKFLFGFSISKEFGICTVFFENQIYRISWLKYRGKFKSKIARIRPKIGLFRSKKCWKFEFLARSTAPALRILQRLRRQIGRRR